VEEPRKPVPAAVRHWERRSWILWLAMLSLVALSACNPDASGNDSTMSGHDGTKMPFGDSTPRFSPDGTHIVFVRAHEGDSDIYVMDLESRRTRLLVSASQYDVDPAFSPDGSEILFETSPDGYAQLHLVPFRGGDIEPISEVVDGWATFPAWAPDGKTF
jgi:Tol biopolymer transport system component